MSFSMINRHKYPWSFILIYLENIDVVDFLVSSPLKIGKLRHCLHFIKSKTFSFWRFQSLAKIKNFRNKKYIKLLNGGVLIRAGGGVGVGAGRIFFQKKLREEGTPIRDLRVLTAIVMTPVWCYCMTLCHQEGKKKRILALLVGAN